MPATALTLGRWVEGDLGQYAPVPGQQHPPPAIPRAGMMVLTDDRLAVLYLPERQRYRERLAAGAEPGRAGVR